MNDELRRLPTIHHSSLIIHHSIFMAGEEKVIVTNRAAFHEYHILDRVEAGVVLTGTEVKSVRAGQIQLKDSYVAVRDGEAWLLGAHISHYSHGNRLNHDPTRERKLLLH